MSSVRPNWLGYAPPFPLEVVATGISSATAGNGTTNIVASISLPAGTYLVGGNFYVTATTTFTNTDAIEFIISDTPGSLVLYPQTTLTGYSQEGNATAQITATVTGVLITTVASTISWRVVCAFTSATGKTAYVSNPFYQRIA